MCQVGRTHLKKNVLTFGDLCRKNLLLRSVQKGKNPKNCFKGIYFIYIQCAQYNQGLPSQ